MAIKFAFLDFPPFFLLALRFVLASIPFLFFYSRPKISLRLFFQIAISLSLAHFTFIYLALHQGVPAGLSSMILQTQTIFTVALAVIFLNVRPCKMQISGILLSLSGIALIASQMNIDGGFLGFAFLLGAAITSSISNILFRKIGNTDVVSVIVWSNLVPPIPLFLVSFWLEGWDTMVQSLQGVTLQGGLSVVYTSLMSSVIAASLWGKLMNKYDPSRVIPFSLLIPIIGITSCCTFLDEEFTISNALACGIVLLGVVINQLSSFRIRVVSRALLRRSRRLLPRIRKAA